MLRIGKNSLGASVHDSGKKANKKWPPSNKKSQLAIAVDKMKALEAKFAGSVKNSGESGAALKNRQITLQSPSEPSQNDPKQLVDSFRELFAEPDKLYFLPSGGRRLDRANPTYWTAIVKCYRELRILQMGGTPSSDIAGNFKFPPALVSYFDSYHTLLTSFEKRLGLIYTSFDNGAFPKSALPNDDEVLSLKRMLRLSERVKSVAGSLPASDEFVKSVSEVAAVVGKVVDFVEFQKSQAEGEIIKLFDNQAEAPAPASDSCERPYVESGNEYSIGWSSSDGSEDEDGDAEDIHGRSTPPRAFLAADMADPNTVNLPLRHSSGPAERAPPKPVMTTQGSGGEVTIELHLKHSPT